MRFLGPGVPYGCVLPIEADLIHEGITVPEYILIDVGLLPEALYVLIGQQVPYEGEVFCSGSLE